ncbi:hypothetical protein Enr10x_44400 [Gimesia panareensis]|uniref:Nickel uptake substrate-specific transmembrane region n=1 Tax=Gimesia panareensis TaxID=2527978 RepID=A0A517QBW1_9PLAN|nr:hypothetical protein [Gimesia panareensis]QDT29091.1 hypothetical protein Enr10x_44400 [Gimesia panareensis]
MNRWKPAITGCLLVWCFAVHLTETALAAEWGKLTGQFIHTGPRKTPEKLEISRDQEICGKFDDLIVDQSLVTGKDGGLANVFVYLRESKLKDSLIHLDYLKMPETVTIQNKGCIFQPHVAGLWVKRQKLQAVNKDLCAHGFQVKAYRNMSLNQLLPPGKELSHQFESGEKLPLRMSCSIHPWQEGWLVALNHPYFATSDDTGRFQIRNLPVGEWEFQLWHEKAGYLAAREDWKRGRLKLKIKPGNNDLGVIKVAPALFTGK